MRSLAPPRVVTIDDVTFRPRQGVAVQRCDLGSSVLGTSLALPVLLAPFGRVEAVGQSFPVYKVVPDALGQAGAIDVALPRRESKTSRGHKGFEVHGDPRMTPEEAAQFLRQELPRWKAIVAEAGIRLE